VKLSHALVTEYSLRAAAGLDEDERALRRIILLKGTRTDNTFIYADSVVMLDRLPPIVANGLLHTDRPIGKLLYSCRAETYREMIIMDEEEDPNIARHFGIEGSDLLLTRTYQIVYEDRPIARITEKFPKASFPPVPVPA